MQISKRVFQENKARQIFWKTDISNPLIRTRMSAYKGVRYVRFFWTFGGFVFLKHPFWDSPFCLITDVVWYCLSVNCFCEKRLPHNSNIIQSNVKTWKDFWKIWFFLTERFWFWWIVLLVKLSHIYLVNIFFVLKLLIK